METKARVLDVGNCTPDHTAIRGMLEKHFHVEVDRVMFVKDALQRLADAKYNLVLVNRLIFDDSSPGMALIEAMQADAKLKNTPVMLISNYADAQGAAVQSGARLGFGKAEVIAPSTQEKLAHFLSRRSAGS